MKNIFKFFVLLISLFGVFSFAQDQINTKSTDISVESKRMVVIFDGHKADLICLYDIEQSQFISLRELANIYNARLEWHSVSKKVSMKLNNKSIDIFYDTKKVAFGKNKEKLQIPSVMIKKEIYVPIEFLSLKKFFEVSETVVELDKKHEVLNITSKSNISAVRYYTKETSTEIIIELDEKLSHTIKKGKNSIIVAFQRGKIAKDSIIANNGAIKDISYETLGREAVFTINLAQTPKLITTKKYKKPLQLVIYIEHSKAVNMTKPCEVSLAPIVTPKKDKQDLTSKESENDKIVELKPLINEEKNVVVENNKEPKKEIQKETIKENVQQEKIEQSQQVQDNTKKDATSETNIVKESENVNVGFDMDKPVIDSRVIANDSQIYEKPVFDEDGEDDSELLAKVKVVNMQEEQIIDDSYAIIDDTDSFKNIMPVVKKKEISKDAKIIVLDAGHGGHDPGAIGPHGIKEKDINLEIVLQLRSIFDKDANYKVILTRDDDTFIPLVERANIANKNKADLFISVHCNANLNRASSGFEVYFLSEHASDTEAISTAQLENSVVDLEDKTDEQKSVLQNMLWSMVVNEYINESSELSSFVSGEATGRLKIPNRGTKQANFYVLRGTQMPSILVETAYISNYTEEAKLKTSSFQKSAADSIYEGVKKYYARKAVKK